MRLLLVALALVALAACSTTPDDDDGPDADYAPASDAALLEQVSGLPGVETATVRFREGFGRTGYYATVEVGDDADPLDVADRTYAVLRQGQPNVPISLEVVQDDTIVDTTSVAGVGTPEELEERYGPQPGDGTPPGG